MVNQLHELDDFWLVDAVVQYDQSRLVAFRSQNMKFSILIRATDVLGPLTSRHQGGMNGESTT